MKWPINLDSLVIICKRCPMDDTVKSQAADPTYPSPLVQRVHHQLRARIASGEYAANTRLPGEHDLAALYGVSRPVVREALRRLRDDGLVVSRQGAGTFVRGTEAKRGRALAFAPVGTIADVQRCYEFRLEVEPPNAFYAAKRYNEPALAAIGQALQLMRDTTRAHEILGASDSWAADLAVSQYTVGEGPGVEAFTSGGPSFHWPPSGATPCWAACLDYSVNVAMTG